MRDKVLIVGGGKMGNGIAAVSALAGNPTVIYGKNPASNTRSLPAARAAIDELVGYGLNTEAQAADAYKMISVTDSLEDGLKDCFVVIEAIYEDVALKRELFAQLDGALPENIPILSNTSGLRITDIAADTKHPERCFTAHFWLPAHLIPLVEVVIGDMSDPDMANDIADMLRKWGKSPVIVNRDLPGQLANRILQAIIRESVNIVEMGLASAEDVDTAIKMGMALRFPVWGPLEHVDAVGFDICSSVQNTVLPEISDRKEASPMFTEMMERGELGFKTGKGFYDWSKKDMDSLVKRRNDFIVNSLREINKNK